MEWPDLLWRYGWAFALAINTLVGWIAWSVRRAYVSREELAAELEGLHVLDRRLTVVEAEIARVPTRDELHRVHHSVEELRGDLKAATAQLQEIAKAFQRIERPLDFLIQHHVSRGAK